MQQLGSEDFTAALGAGSSLVSRLEFAELRRVRNRLRARHRHLPGRNFSDGYLHPDEQPGLGVDIDEELAAKYPHKRAYLPVNRLEDGTMHDW